MDKKEKHRSYFWNHILAGLVTAFTFSLIISALFNPAKNKPLSNRYDSIKQESHDEERIWEEPFKLDEFDKPADLDGLTRRSEINRLTELDKLGNLDESNQRKLLYLEMIESLGGSGVEPEELEVLDCSAQDVGAMSHIAKSNQEFTSKIIPVLLKENKNVVTSIPSLAAVLTMLYLGAGGKTANQLRTVLALPHNDDILLTGYQDLLTSLTSNENFTLETANRVYVREGFPIKAAFLEKTKKFFQASAQSIDFTQAENPKETINRWVESQTNKKIKNLLEEPVNPETMLILVNALYFKSDWAFKFEESKRREEDFPLTSGEIIKVDMMHKSSSVYWIHNEDMGCTILSLPYKGFKLEMLLFLSDSPKGFTEMEQNFASFDFADLCLEKRDKFDISLPKFKIETTHYLNKPLSEIGLDDMFNPLTADFTNLATHLPSVSSVVQKAFIEVNEVGTEAAAATVGSVAIMYTEPEKFPCNRPFMFAIRDSLSRQVLFAGKVVNPRES